MSVLVFDLCRGVGGWEAAADDLDLRTIGFDIDADACATSRAAGLHSVQDDIARLVPAIVALVYGQPEGIIGSPPCQLFSAAGKGTGRQIMEELYRAVVDAARGATDVEMARHRRELRRLLLAYLRETEGYKRSRSSKRARRNGRPIGRESTPIRRGELRAEADRMARNVSLVWQPARWVAALRPRWVALEQVPAVLPLWEAMARALEVHGYRCWTGVLSAERYGVPQTRKRAILLASLDGQPQPPDATHQAYVAGEPARASEPDLLGPGLEPWVSMAQALGWGMTARPTTTISASGNGGGPRPLDGGAHARAIVADARRAGDWLDDADPEDIEEELNRGAGMIERYGDRRIRKGSEPSPVIRGGAGGGCGPNLTIKLKGGTGKHATARDADEPAPTLHFGERLNGVKLVQSNRANATERSLDEPAPTIKGGHDSGDRQWVVVDTGNTRSGSRPDGRERPDSDPAVAITSRADQLERRPRDPERIVLDRRQTDGHGTPVGPRAATEPAPAISAQGLAKGRDVWRDGADDPDASWNRDDLAAGKREREAWPGERPAPTLTSTRRSTDGLLVGRQLAEGERRDVGGWPDERPATTVAGDARVFPPGHKVNADDLAHGRGGQKRSGAGHTNGTARDAAVRVSVQEAAVLQSFPPDWPWVGTQTSMFQQIGNAIPPGVARPILAAAIAPTQRVRDTRPATPNPRRTT